MQRSDSREGDAMMYRPPEPPLPFGQIQGVVVPQELPAQPLWQNGTQLREYLRKLLDRAAVLKAVTAELEAFECLKLGDSNVSTSVNISDSFSRAQVSDDEPKGASQQELPSSEIPQSSPVIPAIYQNELEALHNASVVEVEGNPDDAAHPEMHIAIRRSEWTEVEALEAALALQSEVKGLLGPLQGALGAPGGWEYAVAVATLKSRHDKIRRNRRWRKRKRQRIGEARHKEQEGYEEADRKADEWRAREIAKSIARSKMEKMKEVAEKKAKEERARLEAELEMVLMVEKLQELRNLRIQKLKKQGRFFPDEDDKFMERVRAAVEEEERQAAAAADTRAAVVAIASAAGASKATGQTLTTVPNAESGDSLDDLPKKADESPPQVLEKDAIDSKVDTDKLVNMSTSAKSSQDEKRPAVHEPYRLPPEFHHFYNGSQVDMGALIEVRRGWDAFLMPGGSRIPGHWIEPPLPADPVWASYLVEETNKAHSAHDDKIGSKLKKRKKKRLK